MYMFINLVVRLSNSKYKDIIILDVALAKCQRATKNKYEFGT